MGGPEAGQDTMDKGPLFVVFGHGGFAVFFEGVIFAFATGLALAPAGFDEAAVLEPVQDGVEHAVGPLEFAAGAGFDFLDDGVAVAFAVGKEGQDQWFGGGGDEFFPNHRDSMHRLYMHVQRNLRFASGGWEGAQGEDREWRMAFFGTTWSGRMAKPFWRTEQKNSNPV